MAKKEGINEKIFKALKVSDRSGVPVLLMGNPGVGKTTSVNLYAKLEGYEVVPLRGNSSSPETIVGYDCSPSDINKESTQSAVHLRPQWFQDVQDFAAQGKKVLLFIDEITTAPELVQAALLHLIFEKKVGSESLPENTLIVAAGNYQNNLSTSMQMLPPTMNRFCIINVTPDITDLNSFLCRYRGAGMGKSVGESFMSKLESDLRLLNDLENTSLSEDQLAKIGEKFETIILETAKDLNKSGEMNLTVSDLSTIYADAGSQLKGFPTPRTLGYLVECAVASYKCFGRNGIDSEFFEDVCNGLAGIGLNYKKTSSGDIDVDTFDIGFRFYQGCCNALKQIEVMGNTVVVELEKNLNSAIETATHNDHKSLNMLLNKLGDFNTNASTKDIGHPIQEATLKALIKFIDDEVKSMGSGLSKIDLDDPTTKIEVITDKTSTWNILSELISTLNNFLKTRSYDQPDDKKIMASMAAAVREAGKVLGCLKGLHVMCKTADAAAASLLPVVKEIK